MNITHKQYGFSKKENTTQDHHIMIILLHRQFYKQE